MNRINVFVMAMLAAAAAFGAEPVRVEVTENSAMVGVDLLDAREPGFWQRTKEHVGRNKWKYTTAGVVAAGIGADQYARNNDTWWHRRGSSSKDDCYPNCLDNSYNNASPRINIRIDGDGNVVYVPINYAEAVPTPRPPPQR